VQDNRLGLREHQLFVFSVFDIQAQCYTDPFYYVGYCMPDMQLVDKIDSGNSFDYNLEQLLQLSKRDVYPISGIMQEGIVARSVDQSISFKVANNLYLLRYNE
jgi:hypothetical protein